MTDRKKGSDPEKLLKKNSKRARSYLADEDKLRRLTEAVKEKAAENRERLGSVWVDVQTLRRLLVAVFKGEYREVSTASLLLLVAALLYFLNPLDAIPDFIVNLGFLDDITVISLTIKSLKEEIDAFLAWESQQSGEMGEEPPEPDENDQNETGQGG